ncbi:polyprenol phosphomannose-dependent alpha 1,6 mannosyltransferase MptB [Pedobacter arcticus]|uniref:polyprenol phosphomannose-dependent alpha 1,6 mannosyltransferase MptB n=1 Tax=Pedobacter arcticus TaxID=752140 RepID=UPI0002FA5F65|nr:polyprenol phosphomannose-dependent alpha 1,6 mannosyltransferase MptB [Pedobacter arcticus]
MLIPERFRNPASLIFLALIMVIAVVFIGYFIPDRTHIYSYWAGIGIAFIAYFIILKEFDSDQFNKVNYATAAILRFVLLFAFPLLSDDLYRFFWDGAQIFHGINPFSFTPKELLVFNYSWVDVSLFDKMNSPEYYSVYPPINQLAFFLTALAGKGNLLSSIVILRLIIIVFDIGNIYLIRKFLRNFNKKESLVFLYALNPLVIIELTGNLHFEAVMIFFTLLSFWFLLKNRWILASLALAFAVCAKLLPLIFLPLFIKHIGFRKTIYSGVIVGAIILILFLPFIHNLTLAQHLLSSIKLYYGNFEFNGSISQLLKSAGWTLLGHDPIAYTRIILLACTFGGSYLAYRKSSNILQGSFWFIMVYYLFSAVVHPWYIVILVCFTPFLNFRFALLWSALICLTYYTYVSLPYQQSTLLTIVEYCLIALAFTNEWWKAKRLKEKLV